MRKHLVAVCMLCGCASTDSRASGATLCPLIGCQEYLQTQVDTQLSHEEIKQAYYTACRNDDCFEGRFQMLWHPGSEPEPALTPEQHAENGRNSGSGPTMSLSADPADSVIHLNWGTPNDGRDGDRYTLSAKLEDGTVVELVDTQIEQHEVLVLEGTECELSCIVAQPVQPAEN
jgi:hypothetical protein